jgi:pimeloyl-ACP methyl ester carboxylesterase
MHSHQTAPTQFAEANGIRFAYRRFGKAGGLLLVFNQHYIGTMDYWDPAVTDGRARDREVIFFDNASVSSISGEVPTTFEQMAANAIAFIKALGLNQVDVFGFSISAGRSVTQSRGLTTCSRRRVGAFARLPAVCTTGRASRTGWGRW